LPWIPIGLDGLGCADIVWSVIMVSPEIEHLRMGETLSLYIGVQRVNVFGNLGIFLKYFLLRGAEMGGK
jgi:hypothetical protein